jgi:hypothetical protein
MMIHLLLHSPIAGRKNGHIRGMFDRAFRHTLSFEVHNNATAVVVISSFRRKQGKR